MAPAEVDIGKPTEEVRPARRNVMAVIAYDGTRYHGFQLQATNLPTVQGELERALAQITAAETRVAGAGRTDAGVHALGQVVSFCTASRLSTEAFRKGLNALLPEDIAVQGVADVSSMFHARFSARSREYRYTVLNQPVRSPLDRRFVFHVPRTLNLEAMAKAVRHLEGEHDFASFAGTPLPGSNTVRHVHSANCHHTGAKVYLDVIANAFLPHMMRNIMGTLLLVGFGRLNADDFRTVLLARDRRAAGPTAPAHGLCLMKVNYC